MRAFRENADKGVGVFSLNGKMIDVAFVPGAERVIRLAKAGGVQSKNGLVRYEGDL